MRSTIRISTAQWALLLASWLIALVSTLGSLFFSDVMGLPPCLLCWYQRIFMFPLVLLLAMNLFAMDHGGVKYSLLTAVAGWAVALYHFLLSLGFIPQGMQPCGVDLSCATVQWRLAGFITIPLLSLAAFTAIVALLLIALKGRTP